MKSVIVFHVCLQYYSKAVKSDKECRRYALAHFPPAHSVHMTFLVRYPGSGSKWILELFQVVSGLALDHRKDHLTTSRSFFKEKIAIM